MPAYSTLGRLPGDWLADPLLNTFIDYPEGDLARLIFHELAHQVRYAPGDTLFNESFASAVEQIGAGAGSAGTANDAARLDYARGEARRADFRALTSRYRDELAALYASDAPEPRKREGKAALMARLRADYAAMKAGPLGRLRRLRPLVRRGQQCRRSACSPLHLAGAGVRAPVRARGPRLPALLRRSAAARGLAAGQRRAALSPDRSHIDRPPEEAAMADIHIHRAMPSASPRRARPPGNGPRTVEEKFDMECTVIEGEDSDVVEFTRAGVDGQLLVAGDAST